MKLTGRGPGSSGPLFILTPLIHPHLDYASVVWNSYQLGNIKTIDKVQRCATRMILELTNHPYQDRLSALNLPSLAYRRRRMDMIMLYKIMHGLDGSPFDIFLLSYHNVPTRYICYKLSKKFCHLNTRNHSFSQRVINDWNSLPTGNSVMWCRHLMLIPPDLSLTFFGLNYYRFDFMSWFTFYKTLS